MGSFFDYTFYWIAKAVLDSLIFEQTACQLLSTIYQGIKSCYNQHISIRNVG